MLIVIGAVLPSISPDVVAIDTILVPTFFIVYLLVLPDGVGSVIVVVPDTRYT
jgi:hypothetical protein